MLPTAAFPSDHAAVSAALHFLTLLPGPPSATVSRVNSSSSAVTRRLPNGDSLAGSPQSGWGVTPSPPLVGGDGPRLRRMSTLFDYWGLARQHAEEAASPVAAAVRSGGRRPSYCSTRLQSLGGQATKRRVSFGGTDSQRNSMDAEGGDAISHRPVVRGAWLPPTPTAKEETPENGGIDGCIAEKGGKTSPQDPSSHPNSLGSGGGMDSHASECDPEVGEEDHRNLGGGSNSRPTWRPWRLGTAVASLAGGSSGSWLRNGGGRGSLGRKGSGKRLAGSGGAGGNSKPRLDEDLRQMCQQFFVQV